MVFWGAPGGMSWGALPSSTPGSPHAWDYVYRWKADCDTPVTPHRFQQPKKLQGGQPGGCRAVSTLLPPISASKCRVSRAGSLASGGQRQQAGWQRRISLSGCFLKITLPLSAGQGCSRLNNRSRPALPCSRRLLAAPAQDTSGSCWTTAPLPASLSPGVEHLLGTAML